MNFLSFVTSLEAFEFWKLTVRAGVGFALGLHIRLTPWQNKTDDGTTLDIALGLAQLTLTVHGNK